MQMHQTLHTLLRASCSVPRNKMLLILNATNDGTKSWFFSLHYIREISKVVYRKSLSCDTPDTRETWRNLVRSACACYKCVRGFHTAYAWQEFSCKQLCWFPWCAGKKPLDFTQPLVMFGISNICYSAVTCRHSNLSNNALNHHLVSILMSHWEPNAAFRLSLPLATLPLCCVIIACCFRVAALSGNAALALSPSGIAPELNRIQLSAICRCGQSGKVIDLLAWRCLLLGRPSAASGACAVEQMSSSKRQCGKRQVSLKPALCCFQTSLPLAAWPLW